jgi:hypothetical protein
MLHVNSNKKNNPRFKIADVPLLPDDTVYIPPQQSSGGGLTQRTCICSTISVLLLIVLLVIKIRCDNYNICIFTNKTETSNASMATF